MPMLSNEAKARELAKVLKVIAGPKAPCTAKQIAKACGSTKPTAYNRIRELMKTGYLIDEVMVRDGKTGPEATAYKLRQIEPAPAAVPHGLVTAVARTRARQRRNENQAAA